MKFKDAHLNFAAIFLILAAPFVEFVYQNDFVVESATAFVLACYAVVALVAAVLMNKHPSRSLRAVVLTASIVVFLDVRLNIFAATAFPVLAMIAISLVAMWLLNRNASKVLVAVFGVIFVFIFLRPVFPDVQEYPVAPAPNDDRAAELPLYVHLVLDEQTGVEALGDTGEQRELKRFAKDLFVGNGFRLFGRAYSEYFNTNDSLAGALNTYSGKNPDKFYIYDETENSFILSRNNYLRDLYHKGYKIRVYKTSFINFCDSATDIIDRCVTYNASGMSSRALAQLETTEKLDLILSMFWHRSRLKQVLHRAYLRTEALAAEHGIGLPHWAYVPEKGLGPVPVLPVFDDLIAGVKNAPPGTMFFAHLLLPHQPYSVDRRCKIRRPVVHWKKAELPDPLGDGRVNTTRSRAARYDHYVDQVRCALVKVEELIDAMKSAGKFQDAIVIIHGDHGSRISQFASHRVNQERLSRRDYIDAFATLFAVKAPHIEAGYDLRMLPLERLLRHATRGGALAPPSHSGRFVYLRDEPGSDYTKVPMPEIPLRSAASRADAE